MSDKVLRVVDLFAGPGGADLGIQAALPHAQVTGVEWDDAACATRKAAGLDTVQASVSELDPRDFADAQGLWASPPCQAWSMAGKRLAVQDQGKIGSHVERCRDGWVPYDVSDYADERTPLVLEPLRWVDEIRPSWIGMEQVPPVLGLWLQYVSVLRQWGYRAWAGVLNAADYGVPQTRRRAILMAARWKFGAPDPTHAENPEPAGLFGEQRLPWVTMAEALGWDEEWLLRTGTNTMKHSRDANDMLPYERRCDDPAPTLDAKVGSAWKVGEKGSHRNPPHRWKFVNGNQANSAARDAEQPAPTIMFGHRANDVRWVAKPEPSERGAENPSSDALTSFRVTIKQAAALQGFPPNHEFQGTKSKQFEQVGNAVPPPLAQAVTSALTKGMQDE